MLETDWSDSWRRAFRIELRAEAIGFASRGWPVIPGSYPTDTNPTNSSPRTGTQWAGRPGAMSRWPAPIHDDWANRQGATPEQVAQWWSGHPYSLLVATGTAVDAVEVDAQFGQRAAQALRATGQPAPIVATPTGRWLFLTASGVSPEPVLLEQAGVTWHGVGSWVPLPPTPFEHGVVHWRVKPDTWGWQLPEAHVVHAALLDAITDEAAHLASVQRLVAAEA
ncbi:bifunctional DNA primase/polymerase-like protein [Tamaricihabitans halophyticus]|uniref:Bifunctional DNA primase/polymerase-like protein n=1 Tax=Tamaricihabitans halophyticus TaxID=1262583 RepID=A0A4V2SV28_9PSEU|nr:bifunctional DNA primase/polymerase [Tamaricihabitans halophyticus]TCP56846.1 bifunctional DNA primase/polymerase-like protein [Tamaricihabitans halophyticus]